MISVVFGRGNVLRQLFEVVQSNLGEFKCYFVINFVIDKLPTTIFTAICTIKIDESHCSVDAKL